MDERLTSIVTGYPAPIKPELMEKVVPLPEPTPTVPDTTPKPAQSSSSGAGGSGGEQKKIPKWVPTLRIAQMSR